jgi:hypothetical protein
MTSIDPRQFRTTLGQFCSGVVIATGSLAGVPPLDEGLASHSTGALGQ